MPCTSHCYLLVLMLLIPVVGIGLIMLKNPPKIVAVAAALLNLAFSLVAFMQFNSQVAGPQLGLNIPWVHFSGLPEIRFHVGLDGLNLPLLLLTTIVTVAAVSVVPNDIKRPREFFSYLLLMSLGAIGAFVSYDLFFLYIFHEFALIPTFLLIGIWGTQNRQFASMQLTLYLTLGSLILLAGLLGLVFALPAGHRSFDLQVIQTQLSQAPLGLLTQKTVAALLLLGFGTLVSLFPLHSWAAPGYAAAPPSVAMMHAGVLKKFGLYGLIRIAIPLLPGGLDAWQPWLLALLLGNILYIGFVTLAQKELQTMLGFSSVMHMGYLFLGISAANETSLSGVVILMVAHGLSAALLFGLAGEIQQRTGENRFSELGGLAQKAPFLATAFVIASMASIGLPGLANFPGEMLIFFGSWHAIAPVVIVLALWGVVLGAVYQLRAVRRVFFGELPAKFESITDAVGTVQRGPYVLLIAALLILGFFPSILLQVITPAVKLLLS